MSCHNVMAVLIDHRTNKAPEVQEVLTKHGCIISARIGLHETNNCSDEGLIILQLCGGKGEIKALEEELNGFEGVKAKNMEIS